MRGLVKSLLKCLEMDEGFETDFAPKCIAQFGELPEGLVRLGMTLQYCLGEVRELTLDMKACHLVCLV